MHHSEVNHSYADNLNESNIPDNSAITNKEIKNTKVA